MKSISAFGDSILKGVVVDSKNSTNSAIHYKISSNNFSDKCHNILGFNINNYARFGSKINQVVKYVDRYTDDIKQSEYVIFECGGNDCDFNWKEIAENPKNKHVPNTSIKAYKKYYSSLILKVKKLKSTPVLLSLPPIDAQRFLEHVSIGINKDNIIKWLNGNIYHISNWHEMYNIELFKLAIDYSAPIIDITTPFLEKRNYCTYLCEDGMHPNDKGQALIASTIKKYVWNHLHAIYM